MKLTDLDCDDANACAKPRLQFDLNFLVTAMSVTVLWVACLAFTTVASKILLAIFALTYLFGCWKSRRAVLGLLPAMYLPYAWLFANWNEWPFSPYRWQWIAMLWQLPGILVEVAMHPLSDIWLHIVTSVCTVVFFFAALMIARPSLRAAIVTSIAVAVLSSLNSALCYRLFAA